jgi:ribose 1,5-bisphosphate isomerase
MDIDGTAEAIRTMEVRGAAKIATVAAGALRDLAAGWEGDDVGTLREELGRAGRTLLDTRPTAVSLRNAIAAVLKDMETCPDATALKELVESNADVFISRSEQAKGLIGRMCAGRIRDGSTVMTICNSTMAIAGILEAHRQGKSIRVLAAESRPRRQGYITARTLAEAGVDVTLIVDSAVRYHMAKTDVAVVGADAIASNGAVINKIGTSQLALAAHEARVPLIVCAESYKFSPLTMGGELVEIEMRDPAEVVDPGEFPGVKISNPVFDATPPEYIDVIVTELGVIPPGAAYEIIVQQFGYGALSEVE